MSKLVIYIHQNIGRVTGKNGIQRHWSIGINSDKKLYPKIVNCIM